VESNCGAIDKDCPRTSTFHGPKSATLPRQGLPFDMASPRRSWTPKPKLFFRWPQAGNVTGFSRLTCSRVCRFYHGVARRKDGGDILAADFESTLRISINFICEAALPPKKRGMTDWILTRKGPVRHLLHSAWRDRWRGRSTGPLVLTAVLAGDLTAARYGACPRPG